MSTERRKEDHILICLNEDVQAHRNHWDDVFLWHSAVPKVDLEEVDLSCELLGRRLQAPIVISSMTGGSKRAGEINRCLARAAEEFGIGMGVGSQRAGLESPEHAGSYKVVNEFDIPFVMGNLGAPQMCDTKRTGCSVYGIDEFKSAVRMIDADAVCIHLNYLQEVVQPEGDTGVRGFLDRLRTVSAEVDIIGKETGAGLSGRDALLLKKAGVKALDVGGMSGTSFAAVESFRGDVRGDIARRLGDTFWDWGIPTPVSIRLCQVGLPIIATGGLRNGLDVVRALALGADVGGFAWHLLKAASRGYEELRKELELILLEIRAALFLSGVSSPRERKDISVTLTGRSRSLLERQ